MNQCWVDKCNRKHGYSCVQIKRDELDTKEMTEGSQWAANFKIVDYVSD